MGPNVVVQSPRPDMRGERLAIGRRVAGASGTCREHAWSGPSIADAAASEPEGRRHRRRRRKHPATPQQPTFRARIDSVSVDVIVTDRQGNPVTELTADDFEIRESGKPQKIETFKLVRRRRPRRSVAAARNPLVRRSAARDGETRTTASTSSSSTTTTCGRATRCASGSSPREFVSRLAPRDMVAVMYPLCPPPRSRFRATTTAPPPRSWRSRAASTTTRRRTRSKPSFR